MKIGETPKFSIKNNENHDTINPRFARINQTPQLHRISIVALKYILSSLLRKLVGTFRL